MWRIRMIHHPVCAASVASRHFINGAATPPRRGGEKRRTLFRWFILAVAFVGLVPCIAHAQTTRIALEPVLSGLQQPVLITHAKDGTNRRFIVEQPGRIRVLQPGSTTSTVFLDISSRVVFGGERGLLGLAFHPQYASNRRFFVNYTRRPDGATVVAEYRASGNANVAETTETVLLTIAQPFENHNGGMVEFGPDGLLYIGTGDGGSANDPGNRAQNPSDLLGKMLRLDVDRGGTPEIFASGLRNPWRFSFDRLTGDIWAGDVGQNAREEIDIIVRGGNYGWRVLEGTRCTNLGPASCAAPGFIPPVLEYNNTGFAGRCSVTGGYVYRGTQASLPYAAYVFADFCSGEIFMWKDGVQTVLLDTTHQISSFGEDEAGEIYVIGLGGAVTRITNPDAVSAAQRGFSMADRGGFAAASAGSASALTVGYGRIQADGGRQLPSGIAIFGFQQRGILVSEASVPASPLITSGRVYAEVGSGVNTGIAIANPNSQAVTVSFFFTDANGNDFGNGTTTIPANRQIAAFLNEAPFNGGSAVLGTFTFTSTAAVSVIALRGFTNQRSEFLITTLPVVELVAVAAMITIPHFADGGGWTTQVVLVNPTNSALTGSVQFLSRTGELIRTSPYVVEPRSSARVVTAGAGSAIESGSVRVVPGSRTPAPSAQTIFSYRVGGVTVTEAGVPASLTTGTAFQTYVEQGGAIQSGLAIATPAAAATVTLELFRVDGTSTGLSATVTIPNSGQTAFFLSELPAFAALAVPFQGFLRITAPTPITVTGLRTRVNERRDFLITTTTPIDESSSITSSELLFPHFAEGGGYHMQFILFGRATSGTMYLLNQSGQPATLLFR